MDAVIFAAVMAAVILTLYAIGRRQRRTAHARADGTSGGESNRIYAADGGHGCGHGGHGDCGGGGDGGGD